jgi:hypothetical protein
VARAIAAFTSRTVSPEALAFAKAVVTAADPPRQARARALLFAVSRLEAFGASCGLELRPEVLLQPSVIERFCTTGLRQSSPATRRTVRTNLRWIAARVLPARAGPAPLSRERAKTPYSRAEIAAYLALADAQPTEARRQHASALVCLGAGAGLMGADLRLVRGPHVVARSGGVLVCVGGRRARVVPVRSEFHRRLLAAARFAGEGYVIGGKSSARKNVTTPLLRSLAGGAGLAVIDTGRLRSSWLAACAEDLGLRAFLDAAGVRCTQRLGDIVAELPGVCEAQAAALLGGRC